MRNPDSLSVILTKPAARRIAEGYPWVFKGDVAWSSALDIAEPGCLARFCDARLKPLAAGTFNPATGLCGRILATGANPAVDAALFERRLDRALAKREKLFAVPHYRWVHAEGDGLPGLVIDRYGEVLSIQVSTAGMERLKPLWLPAVRALAQPRAMVFRNDIPARAQEGLAAAPEVLGDLPEGPVRVIEEGVVFRADLVEGQKTGWFFDQRANRRHIAELAAGLSVLDLYSHSGGFGLPAAVAGAAAVRMVDVSALALGLSRRAAAENGVAERCRWTEADVFSFLAPEADDGERFDIVVVDPPAFIKDRRKIPAGLAGYRKLARMACVRARPGGLFFMASCSHHAHPPQFKAAVEGGLADAGRSFTLLRAARADRDHPVHPKLPQNDYLKALTYRLDA
ncbi:class I SAM-dependent rRNA methyltransferase [Oleispirillum naphthae]|uniref:class I SAM-dependent rRNA methyltransferase n=1 Tax=Oleispirillum naphthae TaxID=2838853 RepID=UPI0030824DC2